MQPILIVQIGARQRAAHGRHVFVRKAKGLEIRQAPIGLAQGRLLRDRAAVGTHRVGVAARRLQRVAVAHPDFRLLRKLFEHGFVDDDCLRVVAEVGEDGGPQAAVARVARILGQEALDLRQGFRRLPQAVQHHGIVDSSGIEVRRQLQAGFEQVLRIGIASQPCRDLGQHAQRGNILRMRLQVGPKAHFGDRQIVLDQGRRRVHQPRVLGGRLDVRRARPVRAVRVADHVEVLGEQLPRVDRIRIQLQARAALRRWRRSCGPLRPMQPPVRCAPAPSATVHAPEARVSRWQIVCGLRGDGLRRE